MNELLETIRAEETKKLLESLNKIVAQDNASVDDKIKASAIACQILRDIAMGELASKGMDLNDSQQKKLIGQISNMDKNREP